MAYCKKYKHFNYEDRLLIEKMNKNGALQIEIAARLGCNSASICRELQNCSQLYDAKIAQKVATYQNWCATRKRGRGISASTLNRKLQNNG